MFHCISTKDIISGKELLRGSGANGLIFKPLLADWQVDFGDFRLVRITPKKIRFLAGSATAFVTFGGWKPYLLEVFNNLRLRALQSGFRELNDPQNIEYIAAPSKTKSNISCLIWQILAELDGEEYLAAAVDPIAQFTAPIAVNNF